MIARLRDMLRALIFRRRFESDMTEEFRFHLDQVTEQLMATGLTRAEAERRARASFGSLEGARDEAREARVSAGSMSCGATCAMPCERCAARPVSPWSPCSRSRWGSVPTPRFSA
jgi:hypothetical protein